MNLMRNSRSPSLRGSAFYRWTWPLVRFATPLSDWLSYYRLPILLGLAALTVIVTLSVPLVRQYMLWSIRHDTNLWFYDGRLAPFSLQVPIVRVGAGLAALFMGWAIGRGRWPIAMVLMVAAMVVSPVYSPAVLFFLFIAWWMREIYRDSPVNETQLGWMVLAGIVIGTALRVDIWMATAYAHLEQDTDGVVQLYIDETNWFFDSGFREPLWVNIIKATVAVLGTTSNWAVTLPDMLFSILWMPLVYYGGSRLFDRRIALCALWLIAVHRSLVWYASRALRLEMYGLFLFLIMVWVMLPGKRSWRQVIGLAVVSALLCLTRMQGMMLVVYFSVMLLVLQKIRWTQAVLICAVAYSVMVPYMLDAKQRFGTFQPAQTENLRWILEREFPDRPEFATKSEITVGDYLLKYHTPLDIARLYCLGLFKIALGSPAAYTHFAPGVVWWMLCFLVGSAACFISPYRTLFNLHHLFLLHVVPLFIGAIDIDWRLVLWNYLLYALLTAFGFAVLLNPKTLLETNAPLFASDTDTCAQQTDSANSE